MRPERLAITGQTYGLSAEDNEDDEDVPEVADGVPVAVDVIDGLFEEDIGVGAASWYVRR